MARFFSSFCFGLLLTVAPPGHAQAPADTLVRKLERLAAAGHGEATYHLAMNYHLGLDGTKDPARALDLFRKAAALGDPLGAYKLGCYYDGQGEGLIEDDPAQALNWVSRAAHQGWPDALAAMAGLHNGENGIPRDAAMMHAYFRLLLMRRDGGSSAQKQWLADLEGAMTPQERMRADEIVREFRPDPSPLTIKGLAGQRAAEALVARDGAD